MFDDDTRAILSLIQLVLVWVLSGISFTKILGEISRPMPHVSLAWIPILNFWVLTEIAGVSFWKHLLLSIAFAIVLGVGIAALAIATKSIEVYFIGQIVAMLLVSCFIWFPFARQGGFGNAGLLAFLVGVPIIGTFILPYMAWNGDWS